MSALETIGGILALISFIWVTYDVWTAENSRFTSLTKLLWTAAALFFSIITAVIYYLIVKRKVIS